jgi:hypothetical protein
MQDKEEGGEEEAETMKPYFLGQRLAVTLYYIGF